MKKLCCALTLIIFFYPKFASAIHLYAATRADDYASTYVCDYGSETDNPNLVMWMAREPQGSWLSILLRRNGTAIAARDVIPHFTGHNSSIVVPRQLYERSLHSPSSSCFLTAILNKDPTSPALMPMCPSVSLLRRSSRYACHPSWGGSHEAVTWLFGDIRIATIYRPSGHVRWYCPPLMCYLNVTGDSLTIFNFTESLAGQYTAFIQSDRPSLFQLFMLSTCTTPKVEDPPLAAPPPATEKTLPFDARTFSIFILCAGCLLLLATVGPPLLEKVRGLIAQWNPTTYKPIN
ncbi:E3-1 [Deer mastadenovirus B]|uniref:E3-1 n=1 Tax=Deer mastadenovirus B TaxID=2170000 RepID=A0A1Y0B6H7_9ADEN|nr:E3-1 [Deer mastadenovirus B]ART33378.1 E3-1 [Deer mastadenovirus B]